MAASAGPAAESQAKKPKDNSRGARVSSSEEGLDLALFNAPLWVAPPKPAEPEMPPPPIVPPPLRLQLVGVELDQTRPRALLFDPDAAAIVHVAVGEVAKGFVVRSIDDAAVVLESADRRFSHRLEIRQRVSLAPGSNALVKGRESP
ncbi:MAG: hypothetical protein ACREJD_17750 [Phycisphaerales bacterium]